MKNPFRQYLGLVTLLIGLACFVALQILDPAGMAIPKELIAFGIVFYAWFITNIVTFVGMILDQRRLNLGVVSTMLFLVVILVAGLPAAVSATAVPAYATALMAVLFIGWLVVGLIEGTLYFFARL